MGWTWERSQLVSALVVFLVIMEAASTTYSTTSTPTTTYNLTSTPAIEGLSCTLSCTHGFGRTINTAMWYRNWVQIFQTNWMYQFEMLDKDEDHEEFRSVSGRISVDARLNRHNVNLSINSIVDEGSVWTCGLGEDNSNNLTVTITEPTTDASTTNGYQTAEIVSSPATDEITEDKDSQLTQADIFVTCGVVCCVILVMSSAIILYVRRRLSGLS